MIPMRCERAVLGRALRAAPRWALLVCACALAGCHAWQPAIYTPPKFGLVPLPPPPPPGGQALVTSMDRDYVWDQVVDVVDDYFRIQHEERVKLVGDMLTEGQLTTYPRGASTIFEPWNHDSVTPYDRWEATLQSLRRTAIVRVIPAEGGFLVDVQVEKELEDVPRPEAGAISIFNSQALRNDDALQRVTNPTGGQQPTLGWIKQGRDTALEQVILSEIQARLGGPGLVRQF